MYNSIQVILAHSETGSYETREIHNHSYRAKITIIVVRPDSCNQKGVHLIEPQEITDLARFNASSSRVPILAGISSSGFKVHVGGSAATSTASTWTNHAAPLSHEHGTIPRSRG